MKRIIFTPVSHGRKYSRTKTGAGDLAAFAKDIKKQGLLLALAVVFIVGLVIGALYAKNANLDLLKGLDTIFSSSYHIRISQPAYFTFISSLASSFLFVLAAFLLGLSVWGPVVVPFLPLIRGIGLGVSSGYLYASFGFQGILFHFVVMLPGMFVSTIAILVACREAIQFSLRLSRSGFFEKGSEPLLNSLRLYIRRNGVVLIVSVAAAFLDMVLTALFAGLFSF